MAKGLGVVPNVGKDLLMFFKEKLVIIEPFEESSMLDQGWAIMAPLTTCGRQLPGFLTQLCWLRKFRS